MTAVPVNPGTGNPNAGAVHQSPEAVVGGGRIAPSPPGAPSFWETHCGVTNADGTKCHNKKGRYWKTCIGHRPRKKKADDTD